MDDGVLRLMILLLPLALGTAILLYIYYRAKRKAQNLRTELSQQRRDALRSINLMIQQMDYDAEVLRLMRHARASKDRRNDTDFNAALDELVRRENDMLSRVDRASEFENYLQKTYDRKASGPEPGASPEQLKEDIRSFIRDTGRIRAGALGLLDEKIAFFEKWVESPERREMLEGLQATALFLEKGDASGLEKLKKGEKPARTGQKKA
jgi:hypothetical protein